MRINKNIYGICCIALFACLFISCDDDNSTDKELSRLFRPASFSRLVEGPMVTLSWTPIKNATYYIEYGRAASGVPFDSITDLQKLTLGKVSSYKLDDLWGSTRYAIRIKAVSTTPTVNDSEYVTSNFTTGAENILYPLTYGLDGRDFWILVKWDNTKEVSDIVIDNIQLGKKTITLSQEEIALGEKIIVSTPDFILRAGQLYTTTIYLNERIRGENSVTLQRL